MSKATKLGSQKVGGDMPEREQPRLNLNEDDLPAIKNWDVGKKYKILLEVEEVSMRQGQEYGPYDGEKNNNKIHATFKVLKASTDEEDDFEKGLNSDGYTVKEK